MTPFQEFDNAVAETQKRLGCTRDEAWEVTARHNPKNLAPVAGFSNSQTAKQTTPLAQPQHRKIMISTHNLAGFCNELQTGRSVSPDQALNLAQSIKPDLCTLARAVGATGQQVEFFNARHQRRIKVSATAPARAEFLSKVHDHMARNKTDYNGSYIACQTLHAQLFNSLSDNQPASSAGTGAAPIAGPHVNASMLLPASTVQSVFEAAFRANGSTLAPLNPGKVFDGLVEYFMEKNSISSDAAIAQCKGQFTALWNAVQELASGKN